MFNGRLYKLGIEKKMNISGEIDTSSLLETELEESDFIWLSLVVLALSWDKSFALSKEAGIINDKIQETKRIIGIHSYSSFREFLKAIDFAGRFYQPEVNSKVKAPLKEMTKSAKLRETKN